MVTHPHADHYGGLAAVLEGVAVGEVVTTGMTADTPGFRMWQDVLVRKRIRHRAALEGDRLQGLGEVSAVVLHPSPAFMNAHGIEQANDASLVVRLTYGTFSMLFTGDIETDAEHTLTAKAHTLRATVLKVPHHGSPTSSTPGFVAAVRPQAAIISVGARNPFRHPSRQVIDRYLGYKTTVYRTDRAGGVIVRTDGRVWSAEQTLSSTWHPVWMTPAQVLESICLTGVFRSSILRRTG
jgi:competence protein ComEC